MSLPFYAVPFPGQVLMCDFGPDPENIAAPGVTIGPLAVKPEIWKERQVMVVSARPGLATVVPFSTRAPTNPQKWHYLIPAGKYTFLSKHEDNWVKGDLIDTVSHARLNRPLLIGRPAIVKVDDGDLKAIRIAILHALRLGHLTAHV